MKNNFIIDSENIGKRIDIFISEQIDSITRSYIKKIIDSESVLVNQKIVKSNYKLKLNDEVEVEVNERTPLDIKAENIELNIIYEDKDIIVINKPQGMVVHPAAGNYQGTLVNALLHHCDGKLSSINGDIRPGIVHRIDKDTSGILVVAKNDKSHLSLAQQIKAHTVTRKYLAIVHGIINEENGTINAPIGRHPIDRKKMAVIEKGTSRHAVTHFTVIERLQSHTLIEARLETGRTHQIRVHMSYIKHPLLGDSVYGPKKSSFNLNGQMLHAKMLGFIHPTTNEYMEFEAPLPDYFIQMIEKLKK